MAALYEMHYLGQTGVGGGAIYVGNGQIAGVDVGGGRYHGTYTESGGRIRGTATLTSAVDMPLVTGQQVPAGTQIPLTVDWPSNFADGNAQAINVAGRPVQVTFQKIADLA